MLTKKFLGRSAVAVARELIGCFLYRSISSSKTGLRGVNKVQKYMIVETEAYEGLKDKASHASRGETERNKVMFGQAGVWYVYFTYGMHYMLNIVCGPQNYPAAVLIRGMVSEKGEKIIGPGRLTKKLNIDKSFNGKKSSRRTGLWIQKREVKPPTIFRTPRIGVNYSGPIWSKKHYRFVLKEFETKRFKK